MLDTLIKNSICVILFIFATLSLRAQNEVIYQDSLFLETPGIETFKSKSKLDPDRSALYSAVLPGLGQMYNKQYWKLPIIYGGGILIGHLIKYNQDYYTAFRNAWIAETDGDESTVNPFSGFSESSLQRRAEQFQRDRDFMIIIGVVYYILNIVDAHVAAHLIEFDINDELAILPSYKEQTQYTVRNIGMSMVINLNK
ncbi:DUF5683 domain-containing protein [Reichenbachiella agarivorans]|uniref:DUF5683 domain-containing protein n=1 Tax=Reichenbachiella agarivorans TaxID=2979464 RepID=A0ABY6CMI0_9BACT|nr:DUF5683 domain-containing protein [Reichenbachiella agarivorans]UXP31719.1 DUF5683 domain-containing protein [Reichenbachiella agarivorans]